MIRWVFSLRKWIFVGVTTGQLLWGYGGSAAERICSECLPHIDGDFVHREDSLTSGWVGHAGIKLTAGEGEESRIFDFNTGRSKGRALKGLSLEGWLSRQSFWGAKRSPQLDPRRLRMLTARLVVLTHMQTEYDGNHLNQKGEVFKRFDGTEYFEADCVGFIEGLYELSQIDLTPRGAEGRFLTVKNQRDFANAIDAKPL